VITSSSSGFFFFFFFPPHPGCFVFFFFLLSFFGFDAKGKGLEESRKVVEIDKMLTRSGKMKRTAEQEASVTIEDEVFVRPGAETIVEIASNVIKRLIGSINKPSQNVQLRESVEHSVGGGDTFLDGESRVIGEAFPGSDGPHVFGVRFLVQNADELQFCCVDIFH